MDDESRTMLDRMHLLSGPQFEQLCGRLFEALGYAVKHTPASGDRGIDLELTKDGRVVLVQCKRQQSSVGEPAVRDFFGVVTHRGADKGVFCTNGSFSTRAETWAAGTRVELLDGTELVKLWRQYADHVLLPPAAEPSSRLESQSTTALPGVATSLRSGREPREGESESKGVIYRRGQAEKKWSAAGCEALGIPRPDGPTDYTKVDGIVEKRLYVGPDGTGGFVVVRAGGVLFRSAVRRSAMDYFDGIKLE